MQLHQGPNCGGPVIASLFTDGNGLATFNNLAPGQYSVQEILQPGYVPVGSGVCQNVLVTALAGAIPASPNYPPAGDDTFDSPVYVSVEINGVGSDNFRLDGPNTVHRDNPCVGCGPGGRTTIDTEITAFDFTGNSSILGPVHIRESPSRPSLGRISQQQPGVDFPADSFFDVFAELDTSLGTLHNDQPVQVQAVINGIPPYGDAFRSQAPVVLFNNQNQPIGTLISIKKIPVQPNTAFLIFRNRRVNTPTPTPTCKPFIVGHVTLQGIPQPDPRNATKALTLTLSGPVNVNILLPPLDDNGYYTVNVSTLPPGTYQWRLKGPKYLANCGIVQLTGGCPPVQIEHSMLRTGDANDDNIVNISDFNILKAEFGTSGTGLRSDFNNDLTVSISDFNLLKNNFGTAAGCPPLFSPRQGPNGYRAGPNSVAVMPLPGRR